MEAQKFSLSGLDYLHIPYLYMKYPHMCVLSFFVYMLLILWVIVFQLRTQNEREARKIEELFEIKKQ